MCSHIHAKGNLFYRQGIEFTVWNKQIIALNSVGESTLLQK